MQMKQDFAMHQDKMENERELCCQELAMQQQILQSQQQMMNMFMMTMMGRNNILQNKEKNGVRTITTSMRIAMWIAIDLKIF